MSINGMDCMCEAQHEGQCSCGCDWTAPKEARLEALNADLLAAWKEALEAQLHVEYLHKEILEEAIAKATESEATNE